MPEIETQLQYLSAQELVLMNKVLEQIYQCKRSLLFGWFADEMDGAQ